MLFKIRAFIKAKESLIIFLLSFSIICLINLNYSILRSLRNTLVVSCTEAGAELIPAIQLWGLLPLTFLLIYVISHFTRKYSQTKVFFLITLLFLAFFNLHALFIYPFRTALEQIIPFPKTPQFLSSFYLLCKNWTMGSYYIAAELWKVAILSVLFFGFLNKNLSLKEAKGMYSPLLLGGSIGGLLAGPITVFSTQISSFIFKPFNLAPWHATYLTLTLVMSLVGLFMMLLFYFLKNRVHLPQTLCSEVTEIKKAKASFKESLYSFAKSKYLIALAVIVVADYIAYFLFEVFFLDLLKTAYPDPNLYCQYNGQLTFWTSVLTLFSALFLSPVLLVRKTWKTAALVTPAAIGLSLVFFAMVMGKQSTWMVELASFFKTNPLQLALVFGSLQFCICRAMKGTLFDASKELAYFPLNEDLKSKGKLIIDGLASRTGYCMAAGINQSLFSVFGSFQACLPAAALVSCVAVWFSVSGVLHISGQIQLKAQPASLN